MKRAKGASDWDRILVAGLVGRGRYAAADRATVASEPRLAELLAKVEALTASDPDLVFTVGRQGRTWQCGFRVDDWSAVEEGDCLAAAVEGALDRLARL